MNPTTDCKIMLERLANTQQLTEKIDHTIGTLPAEFRAKALAQLSQLASMQQLVLNFASLEVARLESLQRITLSQVEPGGHA